MKLLLYSWHGHRPCRLCCPHSRLPLAVAAGYVVAKGSQPPPDYIPPRPKR